MERWKQVEAAPSYRVSTRGVVMSKYTNRPLAGGKCRDGYIRITMCHNGERVRKKVGELVLTAFVGPRPEGHVIRHLNGDPGDDRLENLAWSTQKENISDKETHGTLIQGVRQWKSKLTDDDVRVIRMSTESTTELMKRFPVSRTTINKLRRGLGWKHVK